MGTNKTIEKPTIIATNTPRVELANTYPTVSSPADMGGINVSMIHCIIFSNIIENDALAKLLVIAAMRVRPGIRKCKNGMSAAERPSPSKAKLNIGTHCGFLDCVSRYSKVFQIQRVFPLNQNIIETELYVNKNNYKEQLEYV